MVELMIDTGRRPDEICRLAWDCMDLDVDGYPVLIYTDSKNHKSATSRTGSPSCSASIPTLEPSCASLRPATSRDCFIDFSLMVRGVVDALAPDDAVARAALAQLRRLHVDEY